MQFAAKTMINMLHSPENLTCKTHDGEILKFVKLGYMLRSACMHGCIECLQNERTNRGVNVRFGGIYK